MNRIKVFSTVMAFLCTIQIAIGQKLQTYHVVGEITYIDNGVSKPLVMKTEISPNTVINIPYGCKVEFLDAKNSKRILLQSPGKGTVTALSTTEGNSISALSERYVAYVKKQMTNKGLTSQQRYTDFATVTRSLDSIADVASDNNSFEGVFNTFKNKTKTDFEEFRRKNNEAYADFVRKSWEQMTPSPIVPKPHEPEVKPVVLNSEISTDKLKFLERIQKSLKQIVRFTKKEIEELRNRHQPQPATPKVDVLSTQGELIPTNNEEEPVIKEQEIPEPMKEFSYMPFEFYGTDMEVRIDETKRLNIDKVTPDNIADIIQYQLSTKYYDNTIIDCLALREKYDLCDWAYLLMLKTICDQFCGESTNESAMLLGYLFYQSGYKIRFATDNEHLYLLVASKHMIYDKMSYLIDGDYYYLLEDVQSTLYICKASFPQEQGLSLLIPTNPEFTRSVGPVRAISSKRYPEIHISVSINKNLISFYNSYPSSYINENFTTRWVMYANTPLDESIKGQIYATLKSQLEGLSDLEKVQRLLNLVQTGLEYEYDDVVWGGDRTFFAEETLNYPYCDCEDRAILFTRLVRDLIGLKCVLIYYPGHLASAVHFTEKAGGVYYTLDSVDYTVCDPTYINAGVGMQMPGIADDGATLIPLE